MKCLVVVDMQPWFSSSEDIVNEVAKKVEECIKNNYFIVILEYDGDGDTYPEITDLLKNYDYYEICTKDCDDGSEEVGEVLPDNIESIEICGVNYEFCVLETAVGLTKNYGYKVHVLKELCRTSWKQLGDFSHDSWYIQNGVAVL